MGRNPAERMVAVPIIVPKSTYNELKSRANSEKTTVVGLITHIITQYLGKIEEEEVDHEQIEAAIGLIQRALRQKDAIAEAVSKIVVNHFDTTYAEAKNTPIS